MRLRVKICGMTTLDDALFCAHAGADALGFIFYEKSPRCITVDAARAIIHSLPPFVTPTGVFVNESRQRILKVITECGLRSIQLSGDETPDDCSGYTVPVIKSFRLRHESELSTVADYSSTIVMLDGASDGQYGGSGKLPDLSIARALASKCELILAGGLGPENLASTVEAVRPYGVDINSGVETSPGMKNHQKVQQLFRVVSLLNSLTT